MSNLQTYYFRLDFQKVERLMIWFIVSADNLSLMILIIHVKYVLHGKWSQQLPAPI